MWWVGSERADAYLGLCRTGLRLADGRLFWQDTDGAAAAMAFLAGQAAAARRRLRLRLWLGGALVQPFLVQPVQGLRRWAEVQAVARLAAEQRWGEQPPRRLWVQGWPRGHAVVAAAMEEVLLQEITHGARGHAALRLVSVRPWWSRALEAALRRPQPPRLLLVDEPDALTVLAGEEGRFTAVANCLAARGDGSRAGFEARTLLSSAYPAQSGWRAVLNDDGVSANPASHGGFVFPTTMEGLA